jgi:hypothetical protein
MELARATNTAMRLAALCEQEMIEAIGHGWADRDASIFLTLPYTSRGACKCSGALAAALRRNDRAGHCVAVLVFRHQSCVSTARIASA